VLKLASTCGGNAPPVNVTVFPEDEPENVAVQGVPDVGFKPIVRGSTFAVTLMLHDGPYTLSHK